MEIHSTEEYRRAMDELARLRGAEPDTPEDTRRRELEAAVSAYDKAELDTRENKKGRPFA